MKTQNIKKKLKIRK